MDHDADYAEHVRESWSTLVRSAVFLGCTVHEAEDLVQTTLVRCYTSWPRCSRKRSTSFGSAGSSLSPISATAILPSKQKG